ncbi:protein canopy homolog 3 [Belonocnema kinseyi]|uniref:protein canopy homolog 3 n=1 Tax=Belonocnema kinseyi TaxID=2817044 RepID=UPI00143DF23E|nr:protein canopy homolog 3 [Belonocnema kinseyi]XP_033215584.1 protein canopy homolog 3 [Belonocnema kinseyi]XP_033215585.1 protein canopy homolog 3 [Belonocnema kinseyi]
MSAIKFGTIFFTLFLINLAACGPEEEEGVKYADKCEVCKVVATELEGRLDETGKTHDVLEIGYSIDDIAPKKKKEYVKSELRLVESLDQLCDRVLEYNIHKERSDSNRFAKGMSQTFKTLHGLVDKGVKVELGIPYELWDNPSVEITTLKSQCEELLENYEADIEEWYFNSQGKVPLTRYLCSERALKGKDDSCLKEKGDNGQIEDKKSKRKNKKNSSKTEDTEKPKNAKEEL